MRFSLSRVVFTAALLAGFVSSARARTVPDDVTVKIFAKPEGGKLRLLVRLPLVALNDIQFPSRGPGYLDLAHINQVLPGAARYWVANSIDLFEDDRHLPRPEVVQTRLSVLANKSFDSYDEAFAHLNGSQLDEKTDTFLTQVWFDMLLEYPIQADRSLFSIHSRLASLGVKVSTTLTFIAPGAVPRTFEFTGDPGLLRLEPQVLEVARQFFNWGFLYLLNGSDYLLFLFCAVLPFRRYHQVAPLAGGFAVAFSLTFIASILNQAPDGFWFPPLVETAVALAIVYTALENIAGNVPPLRRALVSLVFGLVFGFSFALGHATKAQFAGAWPMLAAIAFDAGLLAAMGVVLLVLVPVLRWLLRFTPVARTETIVLSVLAAHTAWHWLTERFARFNRFPIRFPGLDAALLAGAMRWGMLLVLLAGGVWFVSGYLKPKGLKPQ